MSDSDRAMAARHLRKARRLHDEAALEEVSWARCAYPQSIAAIRMEIQLAMRLGDVDSTDALIAQGLLLEPNDHTLRRQMARRLIDKGRIERARPLIKSLRDERPHHVATRLLAAELACIEKHHEQAADLLWSVILDRPEQSRAALEALFDLYLDLDDADHAEAVLLRFRPPDAIRTARLLHHRNRCVDAADVLAEALDGPCRGDDACLAAYIRQSEACDDRGRVLKAIDRVRSNQPMASLAAAGAFLSMGETELAAAMIEPLLESGPHRRHAMLVMTAINWTAERMHEAADDLSAANGTVGLPRKDVADLWRRAVQGRMIQRLRRGLDANDEFKGEPLRSMLRSALETFESSRWDASGRPDDDAATHASICTMALDALR